MKPHVIIGILCLFIITGFFTRCSVRFGSTPANPTTDSDTVWTNELVQIATGSISNPPSRSVFVDYPWNGATNGAINNPKGLAGILLTNFTGTAMFVDTSDGSVKYLGNDRALADAYEKGVDAGYVLGRIMASRETVRMYVRAYSDPSLADAAAMMAVRDANAATAFRLEEANALSEARKILQESTNIVTQ